MWLLCSHSITHHRLFGLGNGVGTIHSGKVRMNAKVLPQNNGGGSLDSSLLSKVPASQPARPRHITSSHLSEKRRLLTSWKHPQCPGKREQRPLCAVQSGGSLWLTWLSVKGGNSLPSEEPPLEPKWDEPRCPSPFLLEEHTGERIQVEPLKIVWRFWCVFVVTARFVMACVCLW